MNIYKSLNNVTGYIEENLEEKIEYEALARMLGVNAYTAQRLFSMIVGVGMSEYIRKRRLSRAGYDLYVGDLRVVDVAMKYQYDNATSFSRAFEKFHGIKPSQVRKETKLKDFPRITFDESMNPTAELDYEIVQLDRMDLYGVGMDTDNERIGDAAPKFFKQIWREHYEKLGAITYGMVTYDTEREYSQKYYCLYEKDVDGFEHIALPKSKWLRFRIDSQNPKEIQDVSHLFYEKFLPSAKYDLRDLPELEYYHDDVTDFLVPIC